MLQNEFLIFLEIQWEGQPQQASDPPVNSLTLVLYLVGSSVPWLGQNDAGTRYSTPDCSQIVHGGDYWVTGDTIG